MFDRWHGLRSLKDELISWFIDCILAFSYIWHGYIFFTLDLGETLKLGKISKCGNCGTRVICSIIWSFKCLHYPDVLIEYISLYGIYPYSKLRIFIMAVTSAVSAPKFQKYTCSFISHNLWGIGEHFQFLNCSLVGLYGFYKDLKLLLCYNFGQEND